MSKIKFITPVAIIVLTIFLAQPAYAVLYAPGETLDPACAPTDVDCGISATVEEGVTGQIPYYAADGSILTATSSITILSNGNVGVGIINPSYALDTAGFINTQSGYRQNGNLVLYASTTNFSVAVGSPSAANWMSASANAGYNTAVGYDSLKTTPANTSAILNTAIGRSTLSSNTTGSSNTAVGNTALYSNTTGTNNTAIGSASLFSNTTGGYNAAFGIQALKNNLTGINNIAIGLTSLFSNTSGANNIAIGASALYNNNASYNIAIGASALLKNTSGAANVAIGQNALYQNTTEGHNTAVGYLALSTSTASENTAFGSGAMMLNTTGIQNTAVGRRALGFNTTGDANTAVGAFSLGHNITGSQNSAFGRASLWYNSTGSYNTTNGYRANYSNMSGDNNVSFGFYSLHHSMTSSNSTALGASADYYSPPDAPVATAVAGSGLEIGRYVYKVSFVLDGTETVLGAHSDGVTTTSGNQQVNLSSIPTYAGPKTISARKIYRVPVDGENLWYYVATIADNVTTTYTDSTPDSSLVTPPSDPSGSIMLGYSAKAFSSNQFVVGSDSARITDVYIGGGVYDTAPQGVTINATGGSGTDVLGGSLTLAGGRGTGAGVGGSIIFKTASSSVTGGYANNLSEAMRINASGNVGIGTTTPSQKLTIAGTVGFPDLTGSSGAGSLCLSSTGEVVYNSGSDSCLPSVRDLKHDINELSLSSSTESILQELNPVSFIYNYDDTDRTRYGFIADEAFLTDKQLVTYDAEGEISGLDTNGFLALIVTAVKDIYAKIAGFAESFTTKELCLDNVCIDSEDLRIILDTAKIDTSTQPKDTDNSDNLDQNDESGTEKENASTNEMLNEEAASTTPETLENESNENTEEEVQTDEPVQIKEIPEEQPTEEVDESTPEEEQEDSVAEPTTPSEESVPNEKE